MHPLAWILLSLTVSACTPGESPGAPTAGDSVRLEGRWILDADGLPTPPESFTRGLQTSGLLFRRGELWAIGDQRSRYPGHLLRISPTTARLLEPPIPLRLSKDTAGSTEDLDAYARIPNSDFEGLCLHPEEPDTFLAVTEDKVPWIVEIRIETKPEAEPRSHQASIVRLTRIRFPEGLASWREDTNFRFEGIAIGDDADSVYLAFERAADDLAKICRVSLRSVRSGDAVTPEVLSIAFEAVPTRADKPRALLNVNDIQFCRLDGRATLLAILRDQERWVEIDLDRSAVRTIVDLDFRAPADVPMVWVSPEAIAVDAASGRVWIVNDPDSMRGNYRASDTETAEGPFADYTPLLFECRLSELRGSPKGS